MDTHYVIRQVHGAMPARRQQAHPPSGAFVALPRAVASIAHRHVPSPQQPMSSLENRTCTASTAQKNRICTSFMA